MPREADDDAAIAERLKATRGFLFKERTRARQAAVAQAVLGEWPRIEATLLDAAARGGAAAAARAGGRRGTGRRPSARSPRRRAATAAAARSAPRSPSWRGCATTRTSAATCSRSSACRPARRARCSRARIEKIAEVNRRRRPDRERSLTDDLLAHARKLLLEGDPAAYLAGFDDEFRDRVVDALLAGDVEAARTALGAARARGVSDAAILARLETARAARERSGGAAAHRRRRGGGGAAGGGAAARAPSAQRARPRHVLRGLRHVASPGATTCATCQSDLQVRCESCTQLVAADLQRCSNCGALLDDPRAPLLARRATLRAETDALAAGRGRAGRASARRSCGRSCARTPSGRRRSAGWRRSRPTPPRNVRIAIAHNEALVTWEAVEGADAYLVERHGPQGSRVLGRTSMLEWTDGAPKDGGITWTVRALRGQNASSAPVTADLGRAGTRSPSPTRRASSDLVAIAGRPVVLSWKAPAAPR